MLTGKRIWLIGASEGIGAALAAYLAKQGAQLALSARNAVKLNEVMNALDSKGHIVAPLDVTDFATIQAAWSKIHETWPNVDMVIYNAGVYDPMNAREFDLAKLEHMVDINFRGALRVCSIVLPDFLRRNQGHIALVGSVAGYRGLPSAQGYGSSKAALIHLAENLKADLSDTHIKVQLINPGFVATRLTAKNTFQMPFIITPEKAAQAIVEGLNGSSFEIHFPKRFSYFLKVLSLLPDRIYFILLKLLKF
jgi:NADP-dependent 3-hydroxy acid dehydrogenase YdfG